jgi:hypothetical protein
MPDEQEERDVHQPVVDEQGVREPEPGVTLPVPEEEAGDREEQPEHGGDDRIQLLARIQPALRRTASAEPGEVVGVEAVDLASCAGELPSIAEEDDERQRHDPGQRRVEMDRLQQGSPVD